MSVGDIISERRCPNCNELVPSNSITCPKCYRTVPRDEKVADTGRSTQRADTYKIQETSVKNMKIAMLLAIIPGLFGIQGLGLVYLDRKDSRGWIFLLIGAVLFLALVGMASLWNGVGSFTRVVLIFTMIIFGVLYLSSYIAQLAETRFGSVLRLFRV
ncbi:MAG TPA: zinc ribbon domain-containing protein [Candidatus Methanomethylophilaceae archaeon]|nr:zinc ribbon domain-containing protein [Candidatus Methanomethylophilaceae archaeon]